MMTEAENQRVADELNALSLATAARAVLAIEELQQRYPGITAVDITVQALMTAAVSLLKTANAQGFQIDVAAAARASIEKILTLQVRHHERLAPGVFEAFGQRIN